MIELRSDEFLEKLNNNEITYENIYNLDTESSQHFAIMHYLKNQVDNIKTEQKLNKLFLDIEVYTNNSGQFDPTEAKHLISAISFYSTFENTYHTFFVSIPKNRDKIKQDQLPKIKEDIIKDLVSHEYIKETDEFNWHVHLYKNEFELIQGCWNTIHEIDPSVLSGFYSDRFDIPYIYNRLKRLLNDEQKVANILSKFGSIKIRKMGEEGVFYNIVDYPLLDIQYLYKPRDEKGLNYGRKLASYTLDNVSDVELGLKKIEYNTSGMSLDTLFEEDPETYIKYNLIDVHLLRLLDEKLQHIDMHNLLRRDMKTPMSLSLRGSSALFDTFFTYELAKTNNMVRWGITQETSNSLNIKDINAILKPTSKKTKWDVESINEKDYRKITSRFEGAYVKEGPNKIYTSKDGLIIDMDATALYPSTIMQYNISFDAYFGRIIDPISYKLFENHIIPICGTNTPIANGLHTTIFTTVKNYVDNKLHPQNKNDYIQKMYYIIMNCFNKLKQFNIPINNLFNPTNSKEYIVLKLYLLPLLDLWTDAHPKGEEFNTFSYEYLLNNEIPNEIDHIYIIQNANEFNMNIIKLNVQNFADYLKQNGLCLNLSGALFYNHETKSGIMNEFLKERLEMRKQYKSDMKNHDYGSEMYKLRNRQQLTMKVNANSSYGLTGMSGFRFSNRYLAKSTTISGRLALKISQICAEIYLRNLDGEELD